MFPVSCDGAVTMFDNWVMVSGASVLAVFTMMVAVLFRGSLFSLFVVKVTSAFPVPSVWLKVIHVGRFSKVQVSSEETFVKVVTKLQQRQYVPNGKFLAWCMRIAHNVMMDMYRDNRLQNIVETPDDNDMSKIRDEYVVFDNAENTIVRGQVMSDVKKMVNLLPPTQREVVYMRYYQQLSFKEIAELTNVSINTSLGRMRYALLNLRRMAKEHDVFSNITMF